MVLILNFEYILIFFLNIVIFFVCVVSLPYLDPGNIAGNNYKYLPYMEKCTESYSYIILGNTVMHDSIIQA
jgi:hypothetical protein